MIYCVVPEELADELFEKLERYYADDPNVKVIIDRRKSARRAPGSSQLPGGEKRSQRDRRRKRVTGDIPELQNE